MIQEASEAIQAAKLRSHTASEAIQAAIIKKLYGMIAGRKYALRMSVNRLACQLEETK